MLDSGGPIAKAGLLDEKAYYDGGGTDYDGRDKLFAVGSGHDDEEWILHGGKQTMTAGKLIATKERKTGNHKCLGEKGGR